MPFFLRSANYQGFLSENLKKIPDYPSATEAKMQLSSGPATAVRMRPHETACPSDWPSDLARRAFGRDEGAMVQVDFEIFELQRKAYEMLGD